MERLRWKGKEVASAESDGDYRGFFGEFIEEWSQFFSPCNWYTFRPFMFEIEDDRHMGGFEVTFILLGLGFRLRWNYKETEDIKMIKRRAAEVLDMESEKD